MKRVQATIKLLLVFCALVFLNGFSLAAEGGLTIETGGVEIVLTNGWERLDQAANFFVQKRARNAEEGIVLSAGSFTLELSLEEYVSLGLAGLKDGTFSAIEKFAKDVGIAKEEFEKALATQIGRQLTDSLKQASQIMRFEVLKVNKTEVAGSTRFEVHSKAIVKESGQVVFSRQFFLSGAGSRQIVQITYASAAEEVLTQKSLADGIRVKGKGKGN